MRAALDRFGRLDAVVPVAGFQHVAPGRGVPRGALGRDARADAVEPVPARPRRLAALRESGDGRFLAIASAHGLVASPFKSAYVAAKHGVVGLVRTLALEGAPDGICAAALCPGYVRTPLVEGQIAPQAHAHGLARSACSRT